MPALALSPVAQAVYARLRGDSSVVAAFTGGLHDDVPQAPAYPCLYVELAGEVDRRGLGTGGLPECEVRLHAYSRYGGKAEAQEALRLAIARLKDAALTIAGYAHCGKVFYDETLQLDDVELNGTKVIELVARLRVYAEEF